MADKLCFILLLVVTMRDCFIRKNIYRERWQNKVALYSSSYTFMKKYLLAICCPVDHNPISLVLPDGTLYMVYLASFTIVILDQEIVARLYNTYRTGQIISLLCRRVV
jgi:hypothetical protein